MIHDAWCVNPWRHYLVQFQVASWEFHFDYLCVKFNGFLKNLLQSEFRINLVNFQTNDFSEPYSSVFPTWLEFTCSANQCPKSTIKKKDHIPLCTLCISKCVCHVWWSYNLSLRNRPFCVYLASVFVSISWPRIPWALSRLKTQAKRLLCRLLQSCYFDYRINKLFAYSHCLICVSCSVHVTSTFHERKGS